MGVILAKIGTSVCPVLHRRGQGEGSGLGGESWVWGEAMGQLSLPYTSWHSVETGLETPMGAGPLP